MVSSTVVAFYSLALIWMVLKYRMLLSGQLPSWYTLAELLPAVTVGVAIVVVPAVQLHAGGAFNDAWCPDVAFDSISKAALGVGVLVPLFDARIFWPGTSIVATALCACFALRQPRCWGAALAAAMVRLHFCAVAWLNAVSYVVAVTAFVRSGVQLREWEEVDAVRTRPPAAAPAAPRAAAVHAALHSRRYIGDPPPAVARRHAEPRFLAELAMVVVLAASVVDPPPAWVPAAPWSSL